MRIKILAILTLFTLTVSAQDSLYFVGSGHPNYVVQRGNDTFNWLFLKHIPGNHDSDYATPIPGYGYYRVYADQDTSGWMLAYSSLALDTTHYYSPTRTRTQSFSFKVWQGIDIQVRINSERTQQADIKLVNMIGQTIEEKIANLKEGINTVVLRTPETGVYAVSVETYFDYGVKKIFVTN